MEFDAVLRERRSIRKFRAGGEIGRDVVETMLKAAALAPSWKNSQTARYYCIMSEEMLKNIKETCLPDFNRESCADAPVLIVTAFVKNRSGYERDGSPSNELGNGWGCYDLGFHNANLVLKARDLGLDTLIMGIRDGDRLKALLGIDDGQTVVSVIALGYRDVEPEMPKRKSVDDIARFY